MNKQNQHFQALAGHAIDIYKLALFTKKKHSYTKYFLLKRLQQKIKPSVFIETVTYRGVTTKRCSSIFDKIYTLELDKKLAAEAADYLSTKKMFQLIIFRNP